MLRFSPESTQSESDPPLVPLRRSGDSPIERAAAASHARAEHNTKREGERREGEGERGNTRSPEWQFRATAGRADGQRGKGRNVVVGSGRARAAPHTYRFIRFYSSLPPPRPPQKPDGRAEGRSRRGGRTDRRRRGSRTMVGLFQVPPEARITRRAS